MYGADSYESFSVRYRAYSPEVLVLEIVLLPLVSFSQRKMPPHTAENTIEIYTIVPVYSTPEYIAPSSVGVLETTAVTYSVRQATRVRASEGREREMPKWARGSGENKQTGEIPKRVHLASVGAWNTRHQSISNRERNGGGGAVSCIRICTYSSSNFVDATPARRLCRIWRSAQCCRVSVSTLVRRQQSYRTRNDTRLKGRVGARVSAATVVLSYCRWSVVGSIPFWFRHARSLQDLLHRSGGRTPSHYGIFMEVRRETCRVQESLTKARLLSSQIGST